MRLKVASWNVNSLRVRLPQVLTWLEHEQPDALALQETKVTDEQFPLQELQALGYSAVYTGQKSYNGVALVTRGALTDVARDIPYVDDHQRRIVAATYKDVRLINIYVPNGESVISEKFIYKLDWLDKLHNYLEQQIAQYSQLIVLGDFNIAPSDEDVHNPLLWRDKIMCSEPERKAFSRLLSLGLGDTFRLFTQPPNVFSWWDYRMGSFRRNLGLRIDLILASRALSGCCSLARIDTEARKHERPTDHAPVIAEFNKE